MQIDGRARKNREGELKFETGHWQGSWLFPIKNRLTLGLILSNQPLFMAYEPNTEMTEYMSNAITSNKVVGSGWCA